MFQKARKSQFQASKCDTMYVTFWETTNIRPYSTKFICPGLMYPWSQLYRVSQEECARLREGVPYVKVYRSNPKYLCPKLNGYKDNGQRKVWSSCGSTHCTCQLTSLIDVCPWVWCQMTESQLSLAMSCICASFRVRCGRVVNGW